MATCPHPPQQALLLKENMEHKDDNVMYQTTGRLTYMPWHEHTKDAFLNHWKKFVLYCVAGLGVFWGLTEFCNFYYPKLQLNSTIAFFTILIICVTGAILHCIHDYRTAIPAGLERESPKAQEIARSKRPFWEYALAHDLLKDRIQEIDQALDDILNNRVHIKIKKSMNAESYIHWVKTRPDNLLRIITTAKQL